MSEVMYVADGKVRALIPKHHFWATFCSPEAVSWLLLNSRKQGTENKALEGRVGAPWEEKACQAELQCQGE